MKKFSIILVLGLWAYMAVAQQKISTNEIAAYDNLLSEQYKSNEPGAAVIITRKGQVIYHKAFGKSNLELDVEMQPDQIFRIGSITKQFTAVAILILVEQGKINLHDDITKYIPEYPTEGNRITIEHLLTHTSGIRNFTSIKSKDPQRGKLDFTPVEMIDYFKDEPLQFLPGSSWEYSNSGYVLLGYIIELSSGMSYGDFLQENIFKTTGMTNTFYADDIKLIKNRAAGYTMGDTGFENTPYISMTHPYAAGSILSSVEDLFKWQQALLSGKLIKKENLQKAWSRYKLGDGNESAYGYGWRMGNIQESQSIWHGGLINGFFTMAIYLSAEDVFVAVLSNCDCNSPADITSKLAAIAIGKPYTYMPVVLDNNILSEYAGLFENGKGQYRIISVVDNEVYSQVGRGPKFNSRPYDEDKFYFEDNPFLTMHFIRNNKGSVESLITRNREGRVVWMKSSKPIPQDDGIQVNETTLDKYVGDYEITPELSMQVTREMGKLYLQATGQEKLEMFAETDTKFFLKVNDATLEFLTDDQGEITKVILNQGGRRAEAKKIH